jgi:PIN domain-containing protein
VIAIRKAVIDSGPLLSAPVLHYQRERGRRFFLDSFLEEPLLIRDHQEQFLNLLASIQEKLTTSHVIGEIHGLAKSRLKLTGDNRISFWRTSIDLLTQWKLDEQLIRLLEMASRSELKERLLDIGIIDTGLIELAAQSGGILITQDERTLAPRALTDGIECLLVKQLIPQV